MKTSILITGQITGNRILLNALGVYDDQIKKIQFNGFDVHFNTKKEAVKALSNAYHSLKEDEPGYNGISYKRGASLSYDASIANIID